MIARIKKGENMKVVIIDGSYHQNGNTSFFIDKFIGGLRCGEKETEVKKYDLSRIPIEFCKGCGTCFANDGKSLAECPQADYSTTVKNILQDMLDCDILVYSTPVYEKAVTAIMKRFMERSMTVLYMGKSGPLPRNAVNPYKTGVVLISCATPFPVYLTQGITRYPKDVLGMFCKAYACNKVVKIIIPGAGSKEHINAKYGKKLYDMALKMSRSLKCRRPDTALK